jgi:hypothetical protein
MHQFSCPIFWSDQEIYQVPIFTIRTVPCCTKGGQWNMKKSEFSPLFPFVCCVSGNKTLKGCIVLYKQGWSDKDLNDRQRVYHKMCFLSKMLCLCIGRGKVRLLVKARVDVDHGGCWKFENSFLIRGLFSFLSSFSLFPSLIATHSNNGKL